MPQLAAPWSMQMPAGSLTGPTGAHIPVPGAAAHERQLPQGPLVQQTPSVHMLLRHSAAEAHDVPSGLRLVQEPDWQVYPETQSLLLAQVVRQALVELPHVYTPQLIVGCAQLPAPSQAPIGVSVEPLQVAVPQLVPSAPLRQAPLPSQVPSFPQGGLVAAQEPCGSVFPAGTG